MFFHDRHRVPVLLGGALVGSIALLGCSVQTRSSAPADGTLSLDWTLNGTMDPNQCNQAAAPSLSVDVFDGAGLFGRQSAPCDVFAVRMSFPPGAYRAQARLVDSAGAARTTTIDINPFDIVEGTTLVIPIDFPASSFH